MTSRVQKKSLAKRSSSRTAKDVNFDALDLNLLKVFDELMRARILTVAAKRIGKSTAATSRSLAKLRSDLGDELFVSQGHGMVPTSRAIEIAPLIRSTLARLKSGLVTPATFNPETSNRIFNVDIPVGGDFLIAPSLFSMVAREAPGIRFRISSDRAVMLRHELHYGETEAAIDYERVQGEGLRQDIIYEDRFFMMARRGHPAFKDPSIRSAEWFATLPHLGLTWTRTRDASPMQSRLARAGVERTFQHLVPSLGALPQIIEVTDLVATLSERAAQYCAKRWAIDVYPLPFETDPIPIYLVWHERFTDDPAHTWLREMVKAACLNI